MKKWIPSSGRHGCYPAQLFVLSSDGLSTVLCSFCSFCSFHDQLLSVPSSELQDRESDQAGAWRGREERR